MIRSAAIVLVCFAPITTLAQDKLPDAPIPAREAPLRMTVPDGFKVTLFAGEPDVVQPIAFTFDDRGRLWVVECMSYPKWNKEFAVEKTSDGRVLDKRKGKDRIVIFEDTDGDGVHDRRTVFADNLTNLSGIEYGFGGIWLCSIPNLIYIPIKPGEDKPAGPPEIKLDGWSLDSGHNAFNSLKWGPDGWLYGCNGILATSMVGVPGTPDKDRTPINCGVWRYHPTKMKFEVVAHGTTNPWGLDWDEYGELFITNCVIDHVWHVVPGGHYERMYGQDFNPHLYKLMPSIADHKHWAGGSWTDSRGGKGAHSDAGGGHAHVGCMIYQGDNWPHEYRGGLFTLNLHGNRINHDLLERKGSSYVARHGRDFLLANDPWFRGIAIDYGPDGGVYVSDWCDTGECHNYQVAHTTTGRIHKVVYGTPQAWRGDLAKLSDSELIKIQTRQNQWFGRHARRLLQERAVKGVLEKQTVPTLRDLFEKPNSIEFIGPRMNRHMIWALHAVGATPPFDNSTWHRDGDIRTWAIRFVLDGGILRKEDLQHLGGMAATELSPKVRLQLASTLQRLAVPDRYELARTLVSEDTSHDTYLTLTTWYGIEGLAEHDLLREKMSLLRNIQTPLLREWAARRWASISDEQADRIILSMIADPPLEARDKLRGLQDAFKGRRSIPPSKYLQGALSNLFESPLAEVRERSMAIAVQMGDERALAELRDMTCNQKLPIAARQHALATLVQSQRGDFLPTLQQLLNDIALRPQAIQALAAYADPKTPSLILQRYAKLTADEKADAVHTLASRPSYALALLDAVADKTVARTDLNAFTVRQLLALNDKQVTKRVNEVWGTLRPASQEKAALMAKYKKLLTAETIQQANLANGRLLYSKQCASCHKLFGEGGNIGPELTGSQRANLDYLLENMLDPSAVVPREYQVSIITTTSGRTLTGIVKEETERALTVQTQNEIVIVPKDEIDSRHGSNLSMMPEGMLDRLTADEVRDLVAYLAK